MKSDNIADINYTQNATTKLREGTSLYEISLTTQSIMTSAYIFVFILGLLGNIVGLYIVFKRSRKSFCSTNVLIGNMAVADLLVTVFAMPNSVQSLFIQNKWFGGVAGEMACKLVHFPYLVTISASVLTILTISIERYCAVFYYLRNSLLRRSKFITAVIWSFSITLASPYLFTLTVVQTPSGQNFCVIQWGEGGDIQHTYQSQGVYYTLIFIFLYAIPLALMSVLYTLIARKLWKKVVSRDNSIVPRKSATQAKRKVIKLLMALVVMFAICSAPAHIMHYYMFYQPKAWLKIPVILKYLAFWVNHCNSAINPVVYILLNESFRREFFRLANLCERGSSSQFSSLKSRRTWRNKATLTTRFWLQAIKKETCL